MSISVSLQKAIKLQEKIDEMRKQLADLLGKARQELASAPAQTAKAAPVRRDKRGAAKKTPATQKAVASGSRPQPTEEEAVPKKGRSRRAKVAAARKPPAASKPKARTKSKSKSKSKGRKSLAGQKRAASPSGPLAPAVVKVLEENGEPMRVADILDGLLKNGYAFNSSEPKKNLAARIYRLSGVRQVEPGLFSMV